LKDPSNFQSKHPAREHDYIFAEDVGLAIDEIIRYQVRGAVEIGTGVLRTNAELIDTLRFHEKNSNLPSIAKPTFHLIHESRPADISKLRAIGWAPKLTSEFFDFGVSGK
jgi:hypothetical protein